MRRLVWKTYIWILKTKKREMHALDGRVENCTRVKCNLLGKREGARMCHIYRTVFESFYCGTNKFHWAHLISMYRFLNEIPLRKRRAHTLWYHHILCASVLIRIRFIFMSIKWVNLKFEFSIGENHINLIDNDIAICSGLFFLSGPGWRAIINW